MTAISRNKVNIYIVAADTVPSDLASTDIFKGDIKSHNQTGGGSDVESDAVFGGYVDKEKPPEQYELAFEVIPLIDADKADRWDELSLSKDLSNTAIDLYTSATETSQLPGKRMVVIQALSGTDYKSHAYNNAKVTLSELEHNADDNRTMNLTLKFSPATDDGVSNLMTAKIAATAFPDWTELDNN